MREEQLLNVGIAALLLVAYGLYLLFSVRTHPDLFASVDDGEGADEHHSETVWSMPRAIGSLVGASLLAAWMGEAILAFAIGLFTLVQKAKAVQSPLLYGPGRKFWLSLLPPMFAGAILTLFLYQFSFYDIMPGMWLIMYGVAVITGGAFSVSVVPIMGVSFMALGTAALFSPWGWSNVYMGIGFGAMQIAFGAVIARRYGG